MRNLSLAFWWKMAYVTAVGLQKWLLGGVHICIAQNRAFTYAKKALFVYISMIGGANINQYVEVLFVDVERSDVMSGTPWCPMPLDMVLCLYKVSVVVH